MGVEATHYVVLGVSITDKAEVKEFFRINEDHFEFMNGYDDNTYREEITPNKSGIHIIMDGMNGGYVIIGKILAKGIHSGLELTQCPIGLGSADGYREIYPEIRKIDETLGTSFGGLDPKIIIFTHWH